MDSDLEEFRYQEFGTKPAYLRPSWQPLAILITGLEPRPLDGGQTMPEAKRALYAGELEPKPSWFSRASGAARRRERPGAGSGQAPADCTRPAA